MMQSGQRKCMVGRGSGWDYAVMDAGMRNRDRFPVKTPTHQPDSCARSPGTARRLHVCTHTGVRPVGSCSDSGF
jgi:hypothetical protein